MLRKLPLILFFLGIQYNTTTVPVYAVPAAILGAYIANTLIQIGDRRQRKEVVFKRYNKSFQNNNLYNVSHRKIRKLALILLQNDITPFDVLKKVHFDFKNPLYITMKILHRSQRRNSKL